MILAITGYKQSGKDCVGKYLIDNFGFVRYAFADPIRDICRIVFDWDDRHFFGELKEVLDPFWQISPRQAMQWIGTEAFQYYINKDFPLFAYAVGRKIWVYKFINWYENNKHRNVVITDMRFHHELDILEEYLGNDIVSIRVNRDSVEPNDPHASEQDIPDLNVDWVVENNSTIEHLYEQVNFLMGNSKIF